MRSVGSARSGMRFEGTERYAVVRSIGTGGMGVVFEALDRETRARVALKTLTSLTAEQLLRFKREFRSLQGLAHPNLVQLHELVEHRGQWFFAMELVEGVDFLSWVRTGPAAPHGTPSDGTPSDGTPSDGTLQDTPPGHTPPGHTARSPAADLPTLVLPPPDASAALRTPLPLPPEEVPGGPRPYDEGRLRDALRQLAEGLAALHQDRKVHRDIKPSNIRVTPAGRVVLLDFGLVADAGRADALDAGVVLGTPAYMAPEQGEVAAAVGPASDWYSLGVLLFEALTGRKPFRGSRRELAVLKRHLVPQPRALQADVPEDLDALCRALLQPEPHARPTGAEVLRRLGAPPCERRPGRAALPAPFVGREPELARLRQAWARSRAGACEGVLLEGDSGIGKTALARHFLEALAAGPEAPAVLRARCFDRESVRFKALDGVVDDAGVLLRQLPPDALEALWPPDAPLLAHAFPVLRLGRLALAPPPGGPAPDAPSSELRGRLFAAFRALLAALGRLRPLALCIDDLQWADPDSFALLAELVSGPDAPPLLLLATARTGAWEKVPGLAQALGPAPTRVRLEGLGPHEASRLADALRAGAAEGRAAEGRGEGRGPPGALLPDVAQAAGHPLFIAELVRVSREGGRTGLSLDEALRARVEALSPPSREVLELVALAGVPLPQQVVAEAAGVELAALQRTLAALAEQQSVQVHGTRRSDPVELQHDRLRQAVVRTLPEARRAPLHARLALALQAAGADPELLAWHLEGAGRPAEALALARRAADGALAALAFERAARLYRWALALGARAHPGQGGEGGVPGEAELRVALAHALAASGHGGEAGEAYLAAARVPGVADPLDLERRAADQLLRSGRIDEGKAVMGRVLRSVGLSYPAGPASALAQLLVERGRVALAGPLRARERADVPAERLRRMDITWSAAAGLSMAEVLTGVLFYTRFVRQALAAGEPVRLARALAIEASVQGIGALDAEARTAALTARARALAERTGDLHAQGILAQHLTMAAYQDGRARLAVERAQQAEALLAGLPGAAHEVASARMLRASALYQLGDWGELRARVLEWAREADARGDRYGGAAVRSLVGCTAWLVPDAPEEARRQVAGAMRLWSQQGVHLQHLSALWALASVDLYEGRAGSASAQLQAALPGLRRSGLLRAVHVRDGLGELTARVAVALAQETGDARPLRAAVDRTIPAPSRYRTPQLRMFSALLHAGAAGARGDAERAVALLASAERFAEAAEARLHGAAARWRRGQLLGGAAGAALAAGARALFTAEGVRRPEAMLGMLLPGFPAPPRP
jgi:serine/threonine protein kinase